MSLEWFAVDAKVALNDTRVLATRRVVLPAPEEPISALTVPGSK